MDQDRSSDALIDRTIDHELARSLAVDPSPEFVARVRTRIAYEPEPSRWRPRWVLAALSAAAVATVVVAVATIRPGPWPDASRTASTVLPARTTDMLLVIVPAIVPRPLPDTRPDTERSTGTLPHIAAASVQAGTVVSASERSGPGRTEPEVLFNVAERAALRRFLVGAREGRVDLAPLPDVVPATVALRPISDIAIPLISVEPLVPSGGEGVRQ